MCAQNQERHPHRELFSHAFGGQTQEAPPLPWQAVLALALASMFFAVLASHLHLNYSLALAGFPSAMVLLGTITLS